MSGVTLCLDSRLAVLCLFLHLCTLVTTSSALTFQAYSDPACTQVLSPYTYSFPTLNYTTQAGICINTTYPPLHKPSPSMFSAASTARGAM